jgi:hypothetical protein
MACVFDHSNLRMAHGSHLLLDDRWLDDGILGTVRNQQRSRKSAVRTDAASSLPSLVMPPTKWAPPMSPSP